MSSPLQAIRERLNKQYALLEAARQSVKQEKDTLAQLQAEQGDLKQALAIAQEIAQQVQEQAHRKIADVVSHSLAAVFDEPYRFVIRFEQKRGRTEARLVFERDGMELDPISASGGGVIDVASFALRLSCLMLAQPPLRRLLVLDEPFKHLSAEHRQRVGQLLQTLAKEMDCQIVMVTHIPELAVGTVVHL